MRNCLRSVSKLPEKPIKVIDFEEIPLRLEPFENERVSGKIYGGVSL